MLTYSDNNHNPDVLVILPLLKTGETQNRLLDIHINNAFSVAHQFGLSYTCVTCIADTLADKRELLAAIEVMKPKMVITIGHGALSAITKCRVDMANHGVKFILRLDTGHKCHLGILNDPFKYVGDTRAQIQNTMSRHVYNFLEVANKPIPALPATNKTVYTDPHSVISTVFPACSGKVVSWDIETTQLTPYAKDGKEGNIRTMSFTVRDGDKFKSFVVVFDTFTYADLIVFWKAFGEFLRKETILVHNLQFEGRWTSYLCGIVPENVIDTMLMVYAQCHKPVQCGLKFQVMKLLGDQYALDDIKNVAEIDLDRLTEYNAKDTTYTLMLYESIHLNDKEKYIYDNILLPAAKAYTIHTDKGAVVDTKFIDDVEKQLDLAMDATHNKIYELPDVKAYMAQTQKEFNIGSTKQLSDYLVGFKGYAAVTVSEKTGNPSMNKASLEVYAKKHKDQLCETLCTLRQMQKLQSTYFRGIREHLYDDGRFHPNFTLTFTSTGRTSANCPNLQNIPKRKAKWVRNIIKAPDGYVIISADLGQIEFRVAGLVCQDPNFLEVIRTGFDVHKYYADLIFGEKNGDAKRSDVKNQFVFPTLYKASYRKVAKLLGINETKAKKVQQHFFEKFPKILEWQNKTLHTYERHGYVETPFGRRRYAPLSSTEIVNTPIQSTANDMLLLAFIELTKRGYTIVSTIHDEINLYVKEEDIATAVPEILDVMTHPNVPFDINVPITADLKLGYQWGNLHKLADFPTAKKYCSAEEYLEQFKQLEVDDDQGS